MRSPLIYLGSFCVSSGYTKIKGKIASGTRELLKATCEKPVVTRGVLDKLYGFFLT